MGSDEVRDGVSLTNLGEPLFEGAGVTKLDLVDYLDAVHGLLIGELADRPLSVIRARPWITTYSLSPISLRVPASTSGLARRLAISPANASHHLTALRDAGLVTGRREGRAVLYVRTPVGDDLVRDR